MDQAELTLLVNMRYEELGIQQGSCATQKAQLNQQEKVLLAERDKAVKALQENPSDDTRKAKQKCDVRDSRFFPFTNYLEMSKKFVAF